MTCKFLTLVNKWACRRMFIALLFILIKILKTIQMALSKILDKLWYTFKVKYYTAVKMVIHLSLIYIYIYTHKYTQIYKYKWICVYICTYVCLWIQIHLKNIFQKLRYNFWKIELRDQEGIFMVCVIKPAAFDL